MTGINLFILQSTIVFLYLQIKFMNIVVYATLFILTNFIEINEFDYSFFTRIILKTVMQLITS